MANIKSAKKRISTIERRNTENRFVRATLSTYVKKFRKMLEEGRLEEAEKFSKEVYAYIDSACSKGVIHKNTASRKVGRLASQLYKAKANSNTANATPIVAEEPKVETPVMEEKPVEKKTTRRATKKETSEPVEEKKTTRKATTKTTEEKPATKKTTTRKTTAKETK
ncbi:MAG: 30S ribosomal protein S20 [Christensenellales bacterium]